MRILGIYDDHNCGCAIVDNGKIIAAIEEERLSRVKFHNGTIDGLPIMSLHKVLEMTRSDASNINRIAVAIRSPFALQRDILFDLFKIQQEQRWIFHSFFSKSIRWDKYFLFYAFYYNWNRIRNVKKLIRKIGLSNIPIDLVDHHTAHAASAYYTSGMDETLVVTLDGQGDGLCGSVFHGKHGDLNPLHHVPSFHSIGLFYNFITWMLGFKPNRHEGKITGLAAYGDPAITRDVFDTMFRMENNTFHYYLEKKIFTHAYPHRTNYPKLVNATNGLFDQFSPEDIAAGIQDVTEHCVTLFILSFLQKILKKKSKTDVCMAGGVFANVKVNQRVAELPGVKSVYIFPSMGDGGLCAGAALWSYYQSLPEERPEAVNRRIMDAYLGPAYTDKEIEKSLKKSSLDFEYVQNIEDRLGKLLHQGKVIARFNGRMEYGPRALGNRSILYKPTDPKVNDWLNQRLKRTEFMPFAPSSLKEDASRLYKGVTQNTMPAEYMTITFDCTPQMIQQCPATVHVDNTARPQLVSKDINDSYYKIIRAYQKNSGLSTIVNTSFNMHEEPIVCTPDDAIRAFKLGHLDYLAMHQFLISQE